jgi:hypothetical protein
MIETSVGFRKSCFPILVAAIFLSTLANSCQSPSISKGSGNTSDLKLSFKVLGLPSSVLSGASATKAVSKLLLSSASSLTVSLTPIDSGLSTPSPQTVSISSSSEMQTISASFPAVELGSYTVKAVASNSSGVAQFQQSSTVDVTGSTALATLNLVPVNLDESLIGQSANGATGLPSLSLIAGSAYSYQIPRSMQYGDSYELTFSTDSSITCGYFAQDEDGSLLISGMSSDSVFSQSPYYVNVTPATSSQYTYLTVYNSGSTDGILYITLNEGHS